MFCDSIPSVGTVVIRCVHSDGVVIQYMYPLSDFLPFDFLFSTFTFFLFYFTFSYSSVSLFIYFFFLVWYSSDTSLLFIRFDISDDQTWHVADEESRNAWSSHPSSTVRLGRIHTIDINMKGWNGSQIRTRSVFTCRVERDWICVYDYCHRYFLLILL